MLGSPGPAAPAVCGARARSSPASGTIMSWAASRHVSMGSLCQVVAPQTDSSVLPDASPPSRLRPAGFSQWWRARSNSNPHPAASATTAPRSKPSVPGRNSANQCKLAWCEGTARAASGSSRAQTACASLAALCATARSQSAATSCATASTPRARTRGQVGAKGRRGRAGRDAAPCEDADIIRGARGSRDGAAVDLRAEPRRAAPGVAARGAPATQRRARARDHRFLRAAYPAPRRPAASTSISVSPSL